MATSLSRKHHFPLLTTLLLLTLFCSSSSSSSSSSTTNPNNNQQQLLAIQSTCKTTPYPQTCINTLKLSLLPTINILNFLLQTLETAINEATKLSSILHTTPIIETQRGALQDCKDLHQISLLSLKKSPLKVRSSKLADARTFLSAALTNKATCLEGLDSATGPHKAGLVGSILQAYRHVSNSLSMLGSGPGLEEENEDYDEGGEVNVVVARDGSGNFTRVQDAVDFAPNNSDYRTFIYVKSGVYEENVEIPSYKTNVVLLGDGKDVTVITGNRSVADGWTTFRSATVAVSGEGFLARDITFVNTAGPEKHQAVALRINADLAAVYRCAILGYQDTLYVHSFRQFYRECDIYGTVDYIFGNAAVVFQACNIVSRLPMPGQFTVITAQSRDMPEENTGIAIQNCTILATESLYANKSSVKSYLGRPWKEYSRTVVIESYIDDFVHPSGWSKWSSSEPDHGLDTLYYGEYGNRGPGSEISTRVDWPGYHVMDYEEASNFTVSEFIVGNEWLDSTAFPYDDGI